MESLKRVKVFKLQGGLWDDQGTGHIEFELSESNGYPEIVVKAEEDGKYILKSKVAKGDIYLKFQENWIVWNETNNGKSDGPDGIDFSISFQESVNCSQFWDELADVQYTLLNFSLEGMRSLEGNNTSNNNSSSELPIPSIENLESIKSEIEYGQVSVIVRTLMNSNYLPSLFSVLKKMVENNIQVEKAIILTKKILLLNDEMLVRHICESYFADLLFIIFRDSDKLNKNAQFLKNQSDILDFDEEMKKILKETFRLNYLKENIKNVVNIKSEDNILIGRLDSLVNINCIDLVELFVSSRTLTRDLFLRLNSPRVNPNNMKEFFRLLLDLSYYNKRQSDARLKSSFVQTLVTCGLFHSIQLYLQHTEEEVRKSCALLIVNILESESSRLLILHVLDQKTNGNTFLKTLVLALKNEPNYIIKTLLFESLRGLLDTFHIGPEEIAINSIEIDQSNTDEKQAIVTIFYNEFAINLFETLFQPAGTQYKDSEYYLKFSLCDLLCQLIEHYSTISKLFMIKNNIFIKLLPLLKSKERSLILGPVRILRKMIGCSNRLFHPHIIDNDLFRPICQSYLENGSKYNAIDSAILELFTFISLPQNNCSTLAKYFVQQHISKFSHITHTQLFNYLHYQVENQDFGVEANNNVSYLLDKNPRGKFEDYESNEISLGGLLPYTYTDNDSYTYSDNDSYAYQDTVEIDHTNTNTNTNVHETASAKASVKSEKRRFEESPDIGTQDLNNRPKKHFKGP